MKMKACVERAGGEPRVRACAAGPGDIVRAELINDKVPYVLRSAVCAASSHISAKGKAAHTLFHERGPRFRTYFLKP